MYRAAVLVLLTAIAAIGLYHAHLLKRRQPVTVRVFKLRRFIVRKKHGS